MDNIYKKELKINLKKCLESGKLTNKKVYLFGHCEATCTLVDMLFGYDVKPVAIMDNNKMKYGILYKGIPIQKPDLILDEESEQVIVLIVTRFYESMKLQLRKLGFAGEVFKLVDYNTYAEYSLSKDTVSRKRERLSYGREIVKKLRKRYPGHFFVFCPFQALGDIYLCMSYLPKFMKKRGIEKSTICVIGKKCSSVVSLFGHYPVEIFEQKELDAAVQACIYENRSDTFIAHQDRPYVVNLSRALYVKQIPLEKIYCCGVFGLPASTKPCLPFFLKQYDRLGEIKPGRSVILSPYAKSVTAIRMEIWDQIIKDYQGRGYACYTNVAGDEKPLPGTIPVSPAISEIQSVVEQAGTFIGIRSGLCDVVREASCKKIALYPDYYYCDTKWKAIDIYWLEGWENIVVREDYQWGRT